jgi:hypothetical protein
MGRYAPNNKSLQEQDVYVSVGPTLLGSTPLVSVKSESTRFSSHIYLGVSGCHMIKFSTSYIEWILSSLIYV